MPFLSTPLFAVPGRFIWRVSLLLILTHSSWTAAQNKLLVFTVNYPLQYFAQRIAGAYADVVFPAPADVDPAFWDPPVNVISRYQQADIILLNGANYANWINRVSLARRKLLNTSAGFSSRYISEQGGVTHSHGLTGEHSHTGIAFTTWLDFKQAADQARSIAETMARLRPQWQDAFMENLRNLETDLLNLDQQVQSTVADRNKLPLLASHPVYQYFQHRYDMNLKSVSWEPDEMPVKSAWSALENALRGFPARWMIWESTPDPRIVDRLRQLNVESVVFDTVANRPVDGDFLSVMRQNLLNLQQIFQ